MSKISNVLRDDRNGNKSSLELEADKSFARCPNKHKLPNHTPTGRCTPVYCAAVATTNKSEISSNAEVNETGPLVSTSADVSPDVLSSKPGAKSTKTKSDLVKPSQDMDERIAKVADNEVAYTKIQAAKRAVWQDFLQIPIDLKGAEAEKYADDELVNMLPFAIGIVKKQLLFGTEEQQERAATKVLESNGRGKRDVQGNTAPAIIINLPGGNSLNLPWRGDKVIPGEAKLIPSTVTVSEPTKDKK